LSCAGIVECESVPVLLGGQGVWPLIAFNDNLIMYNSGTGAYEVLGLYFTGTQKDFPDKRDSGTLTEYYGAILPTAGRRNKTAEPNSRPCHYAFSSLG
jgi:hypothetical protein